MRKSPPYTNPLLKLWVDIRAFRRGSRHARLSFGPNRDCCKMNSLHVTDERLININGDLPGREF